MIGIHKIVSWVILLSTLFFTSSFHKRGVSITGAWMEKVGDDGAVLIVKDGYMVITEYNPVNTGFYYSSGGIYKEKAGQLAVTVEFTNKKSELDYVGKQMAMNYSVSGNKLTVRFNDSTTRTLTRIDDGTGTMAGAWRITGRLNNGKIESMPKGPRKTMKILSGTRFQWIAFNTETREFLGSGGGTYTIKDGKYTENIQFFAKDANRVGTSITFDASVDKNVWTHKGFNSKGEAMHEEWTRELFNR